jgi:hypothetical protein
MNSGYALGVVKLQLMLDITKKERIKKYLYICGCVCMCGFCNVWVCVYVWVL